MEFLYDLPVNIREQEVLRLLGYKREGPQPQAKVKETPEDAITRGI